MTLYRAPSVLSQKGWIHQKSHQTKAWILPWLRSAAHLLSAQCGHPSVLPSFLLSLPPSLTPPSPSTLLHILLPFPALSLALSLLLFYFLLDLVHPSELNYQTNSSLVPRFPKIQMLLYNAPFQSAVWSSSAPLNLHPWISDPTRALMTDGQTSGSVHWGAP